MRLAYVLFALNVSVLLAIVVKKVYVLPKHLDEKVATLHLEKVGAKLTKLSKEQADYISVKTAGPYKPDTYRY